MNHTLTLAQIERVKFHLSEMGEGDDEQLRLDMIEGETNALDVIRKLLESIETEEGNCAALTEQVAARKERRDKSEARIQGYRDAIALIMAAMDTKKLPLPEATLSLSRTKDKLVVNDVDALPIEYTRIKRSADMALINAEFTVEGEKPNWLSVQSGRDSLTIRRK